MADAATNVSSGRTAGWYVLLLAWLSYGATFFALSKSVVKPAKDITNTELLGIATKYGPFVGIALGLVSFLASGIVYIIVRLALRRSSRAAACVVTAFGYTPWLVFGWDLVYREKRYAEVARAIITYAGKPMLYAAEAVCALAVVGLALSLIIKKRP